MKFCFSTIFATLILAFTVSAQTGNGDWFNLGPGEDANGIAVNQAYKKFNGLQPQPVIVAVLDDGVDIGHRDLKGKIWVNENEIPGNGIDDDNNGYIDDVHGWNFLGNPDGWNLIHENLEITRLYRAYKSRFEDADPKELSKTNRKEYAKYQMYKAVYDSLTTEIKDEFSEYAQMMAIYSGAVQYMQEQTRTDSLTMDIISAYEPEDEDGAQIKQFLIMFEQQNFRQYLLSQSEYFDSRLNYHFNLDYQPRDSVNEAEAAAAGTGYGNNMVDAGEPDHGTHVAGIIAAVRNNGVGINGVAPNAVIMPVRIVPDGDERDKDVALGIRYAVDNGARVINMSFGKPWSPDQEMVNDAIRYALSKDVILVHAAGNDGENNDKVNNYPDGTLGKRKSAKGFITVAAANPENSGSVLASFSNYGRKSVDVLAPGVEIRSLVPGDRTKSYSGTSMAAPVISGMAALLRGTFPEASAKDIVRLIEKSIAEHKNEMVDFSGVEIPLKKLVRYPGIPQLPFALEIGESKSDK